MTERAHPSGLAYVPKRLNQMDRLTDLGRFPLAVYAGATLNVLITMALTSVVEEVYGSYRFALPVWVALVLAVNLIPVLLLRVMTLRADSEYRVIEQMNFFRDQHRFSDWVYVVASANMAFWISLCWCVVAIHPVRGTLAGLLALALVCVSFPAWTRLFRNR